MCVQMPQHNLAASFSETTYVYTKSGLNQYRMYYYIFPWVTKTILNATEISHTHMCGVLHRDVYVIIHKHVFGTSFRHDWKKKYAYVHHVYIIQQNKVQQNLINGYGWWIQGPSLVLEYGVDTYITICPV